MDNSKTAKPLQRELKFIYEPPKRLRIPKTTVAARENQGEQIDAIKDAIERNLQDGILNSVFSPQSQFNPIPSILSPKIAA